MLTNNNNNSPKQFDSIGDEDFYYEETEVDEATYWAIFGRAKAKTGAKSAAAAALEQGRVGGGGGKSQPSGPPLSPSHNSDGLSSGQSFASSSPASSPVCSSDSSSSHCSPGTGPAAAQQLAPTPMGAQSNHQLQQQQQQQTMMMMMMQHSNGNGNGNHHQNLLAGNHHQQQQQPLVFGANSNHHLEQQPNYWLSNDNHHFQLQPPVYLQRPRVMHDEAEHFGRFRGLAASAYYAPSLRRANASSAGRARAQLGGSRRKKQRQEPEEDEQPLQFSLALGGACASPAPAWRSGQQQQAALSVQRRQQNQQQQQPPPPPLLDKSARRPRATYGRQRKAADLGPQQSVDSSSRPAAPAEANQRPLATLAGATPVALADHTYNSPPQLLGEPGAGPEVGAQGRVLKAAEEEVEEEGEESLPPPPPPLLSARPRGRRRASLSASSSSSTSSSSASSSSSSAANNPTGAHEPLLEANQNHLRSKPKSQKQQHQAALQQQRRRPRFNSASSPRPANWPASSGRRTSNHLNHEIFHYQLPGARQGQAAATSNSNKPAARPRLGGGGGGDGGELASRRQQLDSSACSEASSMELELKLDSEPLQRRPAQRGEKRKCRKVYGMERRELWCTQCKWKKACSRFSVAGLWSPAGQRPEQLQVSGQ